MKYKDFSITFANIDANRMYRTECATVGTYWPTFTAAARYVLTCIRASSQEDINFTEVNCDFRRLLREHDGDEVINNPEHQEDAAKAFDLADEYCAQLAATIYNAWDDLCKLYNNIKTSCNWFFGASMEEAASDPESNPWDVYVAPNDVF